MKAFFDVLFASKPTFLGEPMPLTGDGRVTEDGK
jgi:vancomycin permeability regulator SanA